MKRKKIRISILCYLALSSLLYLLTGCKGICIEYIDNLGKTEPVFEIKQVRKDQNNNIIYKGNLLRRSLNHFHSKEDIGIRYLVLNAPYVEDKIRKRIIEYGKSEDRQVQLDSEIKYFPHKEEEAGKLNDWYFYPSDLINKIEYPAPPSYLTESKKNKTFKYKYCEFQMPYKVDNEIFYIDRDGAFYARDYIYQEKWAYPLKVLFIPAIVLDVITFPLQVLRIGIMLGSTH